jgi:ferredoxin
MFSIAYLSPTGNAKHLAKKLKGHLEPHGAQLLRLDFTEPSQLQPNDHLVIMYPVHGFNPARPATEFIKALPSGLFKHVSLLAVGCAENWVNDAVSTDIRKILDKKNYSIIVDEVLAMPLTFIMAFPNEMITKQIETAENRIKQISESLLNLTKSVKNPSIKSKLIHSIGKVEKVAAPLFGLELHANKDCSSCGTCWTNCPGKNIKPNVKDNPKFGFSCLMCMRCIYNCPQGAISPRISKYMPIKAGYSLKKHLTSEAKQPVT